jgi:hypothetical protein
VFYLQTSSRLSGDATVKSKDIEKKAATENLRILKNNKLKVV